MNALIEIGTKEVLLPLLGWVALFAAGTVAIGILVFARCRKWLRDSKRPLAPATGILAVALFVALPIAAGWMGAGFSLRRSTALLIEAGGAGVERWLALSPDETRSPSLTDWRELGKRAQHAANREAVTRLAAPFHDGARVRLLLIGGTVGGGQLAALATIGAISRRRSG